MITVDWSKSFISLVMGEGLIEVNAVIWAIPTEYYHPGFPCLLEKFTVHSCIPNIVDSRERVAMWHDMAATAEGIATVSTVVQGLEALKIVLELIPVHTGALHLLHS